MLPIQKRPDKLLEQIIRTDNPTNSPSQVATSRLYPFGYSLASGSDTMGKSPKGKIAMKKQTAIVTSSVPTFESLLEKMTPHFQFFAKRVLKLRGDTAFGCRI